MDALCLVFYKLLHKYDLVRLSNTCWFSVQSLACWRLLFPCTICPLCQKMVSVLQQIKGSVCCNKTRFRSAVKETPNKCLLTSVHTGGGWEPGRQFWWRRCHKFPWADHVRWGIWCGFWRRDHDIYPRGLRQATIRWGAVWHAWLGFSLLNPFIVQPFFDSAS
jgi:hypothetical protein